MKGNSNVKIIVKPVTDTYSYLVPEVLVVFGLWKHSEFKLVLHTGDIPCVCKFIQVPK